MKGYETADAINGKFKKFVFLFIQRSSTDLTADKFHFVPFTRIYLKEHDKIFMLLIQCIMN